MTGVQQFEIIVIGGGHAGVEAALVAARLGCNTALVTFSKKRIGEMSCNPAIGGLGKGQLVKEVDALFGEMGLAIDDTGIQFRTLNFSRGPAVRSSRAQADRTLYRERMLRAVQSEPKLTVIEAEVCALPSSSGRVTGVQLDDGSQLYARAVVLTTGTFLRGLMHTGEVQTEGGRVDERASLRLSDSLRALGLRLGRLKTGTPARLYAPSIDYKELTEQPGDGRIRPFSFRTASIKRKQIPCWITHTNPQTHEIIANNVSRSPLFNGQIAGTGPRYCPSIEDKVFRFPERSTHQIFLEPEGLSTDLVYPNGISTSLPADVQDAFIRSIKGLENAIIIRYGYAVEYDFVDPQELDLSLKAKNLEGLYLAGQVNGTSGYEEAAAQGIIAGINAVQFLREEEPLIVRRDQGYIGVLIDDLTTRGVLEPYRMFTSRAEYRLCLREDNADQRFTPIARRLGLVSDSEWNGFEKRQDRIAQEKKRLETILLKPVAEHNDWLELLGSATIEDSISLAALLKRPEVRYTEVVKAFAPEQVLGEQEARCVETEIKFAGYLKRQEEEITRLQRMEGLEIPHAFSYREIRGLSVEVCERLSQVKPKTLGQASRVPGVTPAAMSLLAIYLRRVTG
jgi:tRNA uridine 5-carboxymethylaminomethyl modification enzyme